MELDINNYIMFDKLFVDLFRLHETTMMQYRAVNKVYTDIINFYEKDGQDFEILFDECQMNDNVIVFVFAMDFNDANESNNVSSSAEYIIIFDLSTNEFTSCEYQQG